MVQAAKERDLKQLKYDLQEEMLRDMMYITEYMPKATAGWAGPRMVNQPVQQDKANG